MNEDITEEAVEQTPEINWDQVLQEFGPHAAVLRAFLAMSANIEGVLVLVRIRDEQGDLRFRWQSSTDMLTAAGMIAFAQKEILANP